jgi:hypothetical protein
MPREYAEGLRDHKQAIFEHFQKMIPTLEDAFPDYTIIVRPHQVESQDIYLQIAKGCQRVQVTNKGNVVPWLMACKAVILNGCTTSVEAYAMGVAALSYRPTVNEYYDYGFYRLPNMLSHQCFDFEELKQTLKKTLAGELDSGDGDERQALINHHLAAQDGPLACERIIDVLETAADGLSKLPMPPLKDRLEGWFKVTKRRLRRRSKLRAADADRSLAHHNKKNPEISINEMRARTARFQEVLGDEEQLHVEQIYDKLFLISA